MKRTLVLVGAGLLAMSVAVAGSSAKDFHHINSPSQLSSQDDKASYAMGVQMGENFRNQDITINPSAFFAGLTHGWKNKPTLITKSQIKATLVKFQQSIQNKFKQRAQTNAKRSDNFLNKNKARKGVVALPSGLQYVVKNAGHGTSPADSDFVTVQYKGKLINGNVFDSPYDAVAQSVITFVQMSS